MVGKVHRINYVASDSLKPALQPNQGKVIGHHECPQVEQGMMIGTEAENVIFTVGTVMRRAQRSDVRPFGIRAPRGIESQPADLAAIVVSSLHR